MKRVIVEEGWNKLDHVCTIFCDGEGVMANLKAREIELGVKVEHIPPHTPALNPAERARLYTIELHHVQSSLDDAPHPLDDAPHPLAAGAGLPKAFL